MTPLETARIARYQAHIEVLSAGEQWRLTANPAPLIAAELALERAREAYRAALRQAKDNGGE